MGFETLVELNKKYIRKKKVNTKLFPLAIFLAIISFIIGIVVSACTEESAYLLFLLATIASVIWCFIIKSQYKKTYKLLYSEMEESIMKTLGLANWKFTNNIDVRVPLKSKQAVNTYTDIKYFKDNEYALANAVDVYEKKQQYKRLLSNFLELNDYKSFEIYGEFENKIRNNLKNTEGFVINLTYISPAGRSYASRLITVSRKRLAELQSDKSLLMSKSEYNKYLKATEKEALEAKHKDYYEKVNRIIDLANDNKDNIVIRNDINELDSQINTLFDRTVNSIKKIKIINSEEWDLIDKVISGTEEAITKIIENNKKITDYYESLDFKNIKNTCETLMNTQIEFNQYIDEKVKSISNLFGTKIVRNATDTNDEYNYIHQYKKSISPFVAEVSSNVFASAENNTLDYIVKYFYPDKERYPEQIQKLQLLIEELETLKEAKQIIENYKKDVHQYLANVPSFVMENDEEGFYSRLGFATINESVLTVEYKFSYTSNGGHAQRSFTVPMTEETIVNLINALGSKLTITAFSREQRALMTVKLRQHIKERDNFTCQGCGNSTYKEPNLLLEIDHIIPVSKGGFTEENNLQTLCWKCNRQKSNKI